VPLFEFFNVSSDSLKSYREDLFVSWNRILGNLKDSQNILQHVAGSISSVLSLIQKRIEENDIIMNQIQTSKLESGELPFVPNDLDLSDEELKNLAHELEAMALRYKNLVFKFNVDSYYVNCLFCRMKDWKDEVNSISHHQQLDIFRLMENLTAAIQLDWKDPHKKSQPVRQISLLNKLPLSFTTRNYSPRCNGMLCISF